MVLSMFRGNMMVYNVALCSSIHPRYLLAVDCISQSWEDGTMVQDSPLYLLNVVFDRPCDRTLTWSCFLPTYLSFLLYWRVLLIYLHYWRVLLKGHYPWLMEPHQMVYSFTRLLCDVKNISVSMLSFCCDDWELCKHHYSFVIHVIPIWTVIVCYFLAEDQETFLNLSVLSTSS